MLPNLPPFEVNFLDHNPEKSLRRRTLLLASIFALAVGLVSSFGAAASYRAESRGGSVLSAFVELPVIDDIRRLVFGAPRGNDAAIPDDQLLRVLVLGIGGEGHDGPQLTDTMLLGAADLKTKRLNLLSIPRDLAYPLGEGRFEKINAINAYAEQDHPGEGAKRTAEAIGKLLEVRIDHVLRIDFRGFAAVVDALDGVDIYVERSFFDPDYPLNEQGELGALSFKQGLQHMDGATALAFVRSRHGSNGEGSDFARSRRQQLLLLAIRNKALSLGTLTDPRKLAALYSAISNHLQTDLTPWDALKLAPLLSDFSPQNVSLHVLTDNPEGGELQSANVSGAFMLFPKTPDWSELRELAKNPFVTPTERLAVAAPTEHPKLELQNGTLRTGFAAQIAARLEKMGYEITALGNAKHRGYERTIIFDLTQGKKSQDLSRLRRLFEASVSLNAVSSTTPADFLIILGESSESLVDKNSSS